MRIIPQENSVDSTLALLSYGYQFISKKCEHLGSDIFETRIALQKVICMQGEEAARIFYDQEKFKRKNARPGFVMKTLFGQQGAQALDQEDHRRRKELFMPLMSPESLARLMKIIDKQLKTSLAHWEKAESVQLFGQLNEVLFRSVCQWGGVTFLEEEVDKKTRDVVSMIEGPGTLGVRHWRGRMGRQLIEHWIKQKVRDIRDNKTISTEGTFMHEVSWHRDKKGQLLDRATAADEIINMIRPTVAIGRYLVFAAMALHDHPEYKARIKEEGDEFMTNFVQEVRRFYPFSPFVVAKVKQKFEWKGYRFEKGTKVFLDLYGTNHHKDTWKEPYQFNPERFKDREVNEFELIPQGGGHFNNNQHCAGEWLTIEMIKVVVRFLTEAMEYKVPEQDLSIELNRFPALPKSRLVIRDVKRLKAR